MTTNERGVRHGRLRTRSGARTLLLGVAACVGVLAVSGTSLVAIASASISRNVTENAVELGIAPSAEPEAVQLGAIEGGFNVLIVGTDNDAVQGDRFGVRDATLNDVNILLHVSADHRSATVISFPRDLILDRPECTDPETGTVTEADGSVPLNSTFEYGGLACVNDTLQQFTGLTVPYAGWVSFNGVIEMSNAVGECRSASPGRSATPTPASTCPPARRPSRAPPPSPSCAPGTVSATAATSAGSPRSSSTSRRSCARSAPPTPSRTCPPSTASRRRRRRTCTSRPR
ncbi:LCP family protein [Rathayibacter oskolensis]|nr:LCP family protein [Rathayibacter oskolensis]WKK72373.1 LCP family protein [Rathayibacter oskolensis]